MQENNPPSGTREAVATAVREAMARKKISGRALADQLGMSQSVFSRRMTGEVAFTVDELAAVAAALGEPPAKLFPVGVA
jgi:transcriptional regulator with XRE-family HTH domain